MFLGAAAKWMKGATLLCIDAVLKWTPKGETRPRSDSPPGCDR